MILIFIAVGIIVIVLVLSALYKALIRSQGSVSSRVPAISVSLGIVSFGMIGLSVPLLMTFVPGGVLIALIMQIVATVTGVVGLILGLIGIRPIYVKRGRAIRPIYVHRGRAVIGIIFCAVSVIIGIGTSVFCLYLFGR